MSLRSVARLPLTAFGMPLASKLVRAEAKLAAQSLIGSPPLPFESTSLAVRFSFTTFGGSTFGRVWNAFGIKSSPGAANTARNGPKMVFISFSSEFGGQKARTK